MEISTLSKNPLLPSIVCREEGESSRVSCRDFSYQSRPASEKPSLSIFAEPWEILRFYQM